MLKNMMTSALSILALSFLCSCGIGKKEAAAPETENAAMMDEASESKAPELHDNDNATHDEDESDNEDEK
jgi:hypothetical protein